MSWLDEAVTTMTLCWRIERRDGVGIGLTAHDRDLMIDGNLYRAAPGMTPSAIRCGDPAQVDTMDVAGALTSDAIGEADLLAGRWDGARVAIFAVDWTDTANRIPLSEGSVGAVETADGGFSAELRGLGTLLDAPACEATSPDCRATLGDRRCRVPLADRRRVVTVVGSEGNAVTIDATEPVVNGWGGGSLQWLDGANSGLVDAIVRSDGADVTLAIAPRFTVVAGNRAIVREGCDKTVATCAARFGNIVNFRGEPYLPGIDLLTRYPGA